MVDQGARVSIGGSANGPCSHVPAMFLYAASVRWMPSQLTAVAGSAHAVAGGKPQNAAGLKLYLPPPPQQATSVAPPLNPARNQ